MLVYCLWYRSGLNFILVGSIMKGFSIGVWYFCKACRTPLRLNAILGLMEGDLNALLDEITCNVCREVGLSSQDMSSVLEELSAETRQILLLVDMKHSELQFKLRVKIQEALLRMPVYIREMKLAKFSEQYSESVYDQVLWINNV